MQLISFSRMKPSGWRPGIAFKLYCVAGLSAIAVAVLSISAYHFARVTQEAARSVKQEAFPGLENSTRLQTLLERYLRIVEGAPAQVDRTRLKASQLAMREHSEQLSSLIKELIDRQTDPMSDSIEKQFAKKLPRLIELGEKVMFYAYNFAQDKSLEYATEHAKTADELQSLIQLYRERRMKIADAAVENLMHSAQSLIVWILGSALAAYILIGPLALGITRGVLSRLARITNYMTRLARHAQIDEVPSGSDQDEVGDMARAVQVFKTHAIELVERKTQLESVVFQLDVALNNMPHGLCMFDARKRLVVCNAGYADMYRLPAELLKAGTSHQDIISHRVLSGLLAIQRTESSVTQTLKELEALSTNEKSSRIDKFSDGRLICVTRRPLSGGGWVATHQDVTEATRREASFRLLFEDNPLPMWVYDTESLSFLAANDAAIAHYGFSREQFLSMTLLDIRPLGERDRLTTVVRGAGEATQGEQTWRHCKSDGTEIEVTVYSQAMSYERHSASLVVVIDVTDQKRAERERDRNRSFLTEIVENIPVMIAVKEAATRKFVLVNRAMESFWGVPRTTALGKNVSEIFPKAQADEINKVDDEVVRSDRPLMLDAHVNNSITGVERVVTSKRLAIRDGGGEPRYLISVVEDVTEHKVAEERIKYLAHHDALTELPNRAVFRKELEHSLEAVQFGQRLAVLYLDLDNFKAINDTLGHPVGDELLKIVAGRLRRCIGTADIVARLGGDEFAIIQTNITDPIDVIDLATRIHAALGEACDVDGHQLSTDTSIGISLAPDDATDPDLLLKNADLALYGAKADGRGKYRFFELEMDARIKEKRALESDLRLAILAGELELHYQPVVNIRDDRPSGCEALLRWRHPERGIIPPSEFIPIAEDTGLIIALGEWVLSRACAEAVSWPGNIKIAVNVSPIQLTTENFVQVVINALAASRLPANRLELEITEAVLIHDEEVALVVLHQLRGLGVRIAMDDFGTGYSSLSYLQRFPFDKIKIDRSFIENIVEPGGSLSIVRAVISIAESRNITTTAEGVETGQQLELLRSLGCTEMQGYLFSPARPASEVMRLFDLNREVAASAA
jgi:diguanylate cyclase (GGDEF)-like protein/PAS domain S-box-containing protein